jgi:hypothetical protein
MKSDCLLTRGPAEWMANCQSGAGVDPELSDVGEGNVRKRSLSLKNSICTYRNTSDFYGLPSSFCSRCIHFGQQPS